MPEYNEIGDLRSYNVSMGRPIMDKLFFVDKVNANVIVDYGSADGLLIEHLMPWYPDAQFIGYDNNPEMNRLARQRCGNGRVRFFEDWTELQNHIWGSVPGHGAATAEKPQRTAIILSSVVHEVYHYSEVKEVDTFWSRVFGPLFDAVIIRDMIPARSIDRPADVNDIAKVYRKFLQTFELKDFETNYGSIESNRNLVHFLLKYRYTQPNWAREVKENYFPLYREDLLAHIPVEYDITYHEHFVLPFLRRQVMHDFRIDLKDPTHLKLIVERTPCP